MAANDGIEVNHLGANNTLVRVTGQGRYLMLPVQESNDEAVINIIVDGKAEGKINVRLAKNKVDHSMPLDLQKYEGKNVVLNIVTKHDRTSMREAKDDAAWNNITLVDSLNLENIEVYRPIYHHTPVYGWMNDPNGMYYADGRWYLAYQWNPYGSKWQNMNWGESSSTDLIHWDRSITPAIEPDGLGMVFSGSAAIDHTGSAGFGDDVVVAMFTSADASQVQSLAHKDPQTGQYVVYEGNPVLTLESEARDPNMFWNEEAGQWVLTLAHALDKEMLIFTSPDLKNWTLQSAFGKGLGAQGGVWECPDLFPLNVDGTDQVKWMLVCNLNPGGPFGGSATQYFIGDFDGKTFTADLDADGNVPTKWLDHGKDHYATVSFSDTTGRRTVIGWMSNWQYANEVPTLQFRSANTLPRDLALFTAPDGQIYAATTPSPELEALRGQIVAQAKNKSLGTKALTYSLPASNRGACEIIAEIEAETADSVNLIIGNASGEKTVVSYNPTDNTVSVDRRESGVTAFSEEFPAVTVAPAFTADGKVTLRMFLDTSSLEVFDGKDGRFVLTNLVFPANPYTTLSVDAQGGRARLTSLKVYSINF
ncbi:MAG: GH32 C-terminal domain-containing protein [Muribaculaceae bacterium]|nr:GH32 C-terminal domain-containing protein [Muribaculaceae bacterium]